MLFDDIASIPRERIPGLIAALAARLVCEPDRAAPDPDKQPEPLVDAKTLAAHLSLHESWIRSEQRAGRIPFVQCGRFVRFDETAVRVAIEARRELK
jgi:hypothetical protein